MNREKTLQEMSGVELTAKINKIKIIWLGISTISFFLLFLSFIFDFIFINQFDWLIKLILFVLPFLFISVALVKAHKYERERLFRKFRR